MNIIQQPSPNFDNRDEHTIDMLVLHYTGMKTGGEALARLCDKEAKVSAHYLVEENGDVFQLVEEKNRAWHAGVSFWRGHSNINQRSVGIEIVNPGHEFGYHPFPDAQMKTVTELSKAIITRHLIEAHNVVGHSDIAPCRKEDPGELFDWHDLATHGVGLWPIPLPPGFSTEPPMGQVKGSRSLLTAPYHTTTAEHLAEYGYDTADLPKAITAFQRHFRPKQLNGQWDDECAALLAGLLQLV